MTHSGDSQCEADGSHDSNSENSRSSTNDCPRDSSERRKLNENNNNNGNTNTNINNNDNNNILDTSITSSSSSTNSLFEIDWTKDIDYTISTEDNWATNGKLIYVCSVYIVCSVCSVVCVLI